MSVRPIEAVRVWWSHLTPPMRVVALGGTGVAVLGAFALVMFGVAGRGCSSRADVEARVAMTSSALQQAAAQGNLKVEELAGGVKRLNAAATAYEADKDAGAFCETLEGLTDELKLGG